MNRIILSIILAFLSSVAFAQTTVTIRGTVTSADDNQPLNGAAVLIEGTTSGEITGSDGQYTISATPGDVLVFSFLGMESQYITVRGQAVINVALAPDANVLEDVVVTALAIKREEKVLGYAVQRLDENAVQKVQGLDIATSLTGKVAGMTVFNSSDFGKAASIELRGENPLLVIDGAPYSNMQLRDIAAEDIESIEVLKGATASALYGYRGASGAIMVTTKNGSSGDTGLTVTLSSNTMFNAGFVAIPEKQAVYGRGTNSQYNKDVSDSWGPVMDGTIRTQWDPISKEYRDYPYLPVGKDNFKNFLETGYVTNNTLSLAYQGNVASLRTSFNWSENKGVYPNNKYDKYGLTFGGNINMKKFQMDINMAYHKQLSPNIGFNGYTSYDPMYSILIWSAADYDILDYKDNYWIIPGEVQNYTYKSDKRNCPYFDCYEKVKPYNRDIFNASIGMTYEFTPWLKAVVRSGLDFYVTREDLKVSMDSCVSTGNTCAGDGGTWIGESKGGYATWRKTGYSMNTDFMLMADKTFGKFTVEGMIGGRSEATYTTASMNRSMQTRKEDCLSLAISLLKHLSILSRPAPAFKNVK